MGRPGRRLVLDICHPMADPVVRESDHANGSHPDVA